MYNFHINKYYNIDSIIHKLNPLCKIISILIFTFLVLFTNNIILLIILLLFTFILLYISHIPINVYLMGMKGMLFFCIFVFLINLLFGGFLSAFNSIIKLLLFVLYSHLLLYTTKPNDMTLGLRKFLSPLKVIGLDSNSIALTISLAIRFIPTIFKEGYRVYKSQVSRGLNFSGNLPTKCDKLISIVIPVFNLSLKRTDDLSFVLDTKLYNPNKNRTEYNDKGFSILDENYILVHVLLIFICILIEVAL